MRARKRASLRRLRMRVDRLSPSPLDPALCRITPENVLLVVHIEIHCRISRRRNGSSLCSHS